MVKGYCDETNNSISDKSKVEIYAKLTGTAIEAHGGVYLALSIAFPTYEQGMKELRVLSFFECRECDRGA